MNLEYFISSLPMLLEDQPAKISPEDFATLCGEHLDPALAAAAREMLGVAGNGGATAAAHPFVRAWRDGETQLRNAIAEERARRRKAASRPDPRETRGCDPSLPQRVSAAFAAQDPLSRERAIDHIRWIALDEMQGVSPFSEAAVLAYAGKLALNARRFAVSEDKGMERFKVLTAQ